MTTTPSDRKLVQNQVAELVETAIADGVAPERLEAVLQREAQNIRQTRRVSEVFAFECPVGACRETATQAIDRSALYCDVCGEQLELFASTVHSDDGVDVMKFTCDTHETVRAHRFPRDDRSCPHHRKQMDLVESHTQEITECYER